MTPEQKAQEILDVFLKSYTTLQDVFQLFNIPENVPQDRFITQMATHAAISTVHAIIYEIHHIRKPELTIFYLDINTKECQDGEDRINYWDEVVKVLQQQW